MTLDTGGSTKLTQITEAQLRQAFEDDEQRGEFIILGQTEEVYIQAAGEGEGPYSLEYRDGDSDHHFSAGENLHKRDVLHAFLWYLARDGRWRSEFAWEKMAL
jgi:hypothetical protein